MTGIAAFGLTDTGLLRENNEDVFVVLPDAGAFAVADGIGGASSGEVAAAIFAETVSDAAVAAAPVTEEQASGLIETIFREANRAIFSRTRKNPYLAGMGCTAELALFVGDTFVIGHVGDSRSYLFDGNRLRRITKDHSLVQEQIDQGLISEEEARSHALRSVIRRAVGSAAPIKIDIHRGSLRSGEILLLCSDGLTDMVSDVDIRAVLASAGPLSVMAQRLIDLAKSGGGKDNITVVLCGRVISADQGQIIS